MTTRKRNGTTSKTVSIRLRPGQQVVIDAPTTGNGHRLCGVHEIATMLGVSRQHVYQLTRRPDFPPPLADLAMGSVWDGDTITAWNADRARRRT